MHFPDIRKNLKLKTKKLGNFWSQFNFEPLNCNFKALESLRNQKISAKRVGFVFLALFLAIFNINSHTLTTAPHFFSYLFSLTSWKIYWARWKFIVLVLITRNSAWINQSKIYYTESFYDLFMPHWMLRDFFYIFKWFMEFPFCFETMNGIS